jgi:hypothetical protein
MLILGGYVTNHGNDKKELVPTVASVGPGIRKINAALTSGEIPEAKAAERALSVFAAINLARTHGFKGTIEQRRGAVSGGNSAEGKPKSVFSTSPPLVILFDAGGVLNPRLIRRFAAD